MTDDRLVAKTERYRDMLARALDHAEARDDDGEELIGMARSYLEDGRHYERDGDHVTALASYSYGHGWLDAGVRADAIAADDPELFAVDP